jgi:hypothetical protein
MLVIRFIQIKEIKVEVELLPNNKTQECAAKPVLIGSFLTSIDSFLTSIDSFLTSIDSFLTSIDSFLTSIGLFLTSIDHFVFCGFISFIL